MGTVRVGNCPGWELSGMGIARWELSGMGTVRDRNCPGWELSGMGIVRIPFLRIKHKVTCFFQLTFNISNLLISTFIIY